MEFLSNLWTTPKLAKKTPKKTLIILFINMQQNILHMELVWYNC